ncbi:MAG: 3'-5' exonuclease [Halieaceae bacterium]|nr:3'-5' exonuclease [Halieaceae bacterium]
MPASVDLPRWRWRRRADEALRAFWSESLPSKRSHWRDVEFLVLDAEMSSLDPEEGELLSLGWVVIRGGAIALDTAHHLVIRPTNSVGQSATIHQLRDCEVAAGVDAAQALDQLLQAARGRVLVFHHAPLDLAYLDRLCMTCHGAPLLQPHLCTLQMEKRLLERREQALKRGDLTLGSCRRRYHLPDYHGHNALWDALATAELLLAQLAHRGRGGKLVLKEL